MELLPRRRETIGSYLGSKRFNDRMKTEHLPSETFKAELFYLAVTVNQFDLAFTLADTVILEIALTSTH
ncbi:hypothetical protein N7456_007085 [Penicillium angulare]|uniref:Uncharacterized protein n=1 Tax=Penicillium angulare TaxID=116970 RepID=A0A9W9FIV0_9EURO|nr:hypothetical protein N7456_007085 [Penicillium angulare]